MVMYTSRRSSLLHDRFRDSTGSEQVILQEYTPGQGDFCLRWHLGSHPQPGIGVYQEILFSPPMPYEEPNLHERKYADIANQPAISLGRISRDHREDILEYACDIVDVCAGRPHASHVWMVTLLRKLCNQSIISRDVYYAAIQRFFPAQRALHV